eukprot:sb/3464851/
MTVCYVIASMHCQCRDPSSGDLKTSRTIDWRWNFVKRTSGAGDIAPAKKSTAKLCRVLTSLKQGLLRVPTPRSLGGVENARARDLQRMSSEEVFMKEKCCIAYEVRQDRGSRHMQGRGKVFSTDDFFYDEYGEYQFDPYHLEEAHQWNLSRVKDALVEDVSPILVDNTNLQFWEMRPYCFEAAMVGYRCYFLEPPTEWKFKINQLFRKNQHGLTKPKLIAQLERYERNPTLQKVIGPVLWEKIQREKKKKKKKDLSNLEENAKNQTGSEPCLEDQKTEVLEDKLLSELCSIETEEQPQKHSFEEVIAQHEVWTIIIDLNRKNQHGLTKPKLIAQLERYERNPTLQKVIGPVLWEKIQREKKKKKKKDLSNLEENAKNQTGSEPCLEDQKTEVLEDKLLSELCSIETEEQPQKHSFEEVIAQHESSKTLQIGFI